MSKTIDLKKARNEVRHILNQWRKGNCTERISYPLDDIMDVLSWWGLAKFEAGYNQGRFDIKMDSKFNRKWIDKSIDILNRERMK